MNGDLFLWVLARVCGLGAFAALSISLLTGAALRTAVLDWLGSNRAIRAVHEYTALLWIPLGVLHVVTLLLDSTARLGLLDVVVPVRTQYGTLPIGLGSLTFDVFVVVGVTGWLRRRMPAAAWRWIHRLAYPAYGLLFLHAVLGGTDFSDPVVSALTWSVAFGLVVISGARVLWGRLPA